MSRACCSRASRAFVFIEVKHSPYAWFRSDSPSVTSSAVVVLNIEYKYRNIFNLCGKCSEILYSKMEPYAKNMHLRWLNKCRKNHITKFYIKCSISLLSGVKYWSGSNTGRILVWPSTCVRLYYNHHLNNCYFYS